MGWAVLAIAGDEFSAAANSIMQPIAAPLAAERIDLEMLDANSLITNMLVTLGPMDFATGGLLGLQSNHEGPVTAR
jgi:hypothetical protein